MHFRELWSFFAYYYFCSVILVAVIPVLLLVLFGNVDGYFGKGVAITFALFFAPVVGGLYLLLPCLFYTLFSSALLSIVRGYDWLVFTSSSLSSSGILLFMIYELVEYPTHIDLLYVGWFFISTIFLSWFYYRE